MPGEEKDPRPEDRTGWLRKNKEKILGGAVAVAAIAVLGAGLFRAYAPHQDAPPSPALPGTEIGIVDMHRAMQAHGAYAQLKKLREESLAMEADLEQEKKLALTSRMPAPEPPKAEDQPFQEAAKQKQAQNALKEHTAYLAKRQELEAAKREELKPGYERERDEINARYLNEILNIRLKLDNWDTMGLSEATVKNLQKQMEDLQHERGDRQRELRQHNEEAVQAYLAELDQAHEAEWRSIRAQESERLKAEESAQQAEAQERNARTMQEQLMAIGDWQQRAVRKKAALDAKKAEIQAMESHMLNDIAGKASKLAILHRLTLILASPALGSSSGLDARYPGGETPMGNSGESFPAIRIDALDLTEELIQEMQG